MIPKRPMNPFSGQYPLKRKSRFLFPLFLLCTPSNEIESEGKEEANLLKGDD